jgi:hypothetical protein
MVQGSLVYGNQRFGWICCFRLQGSFFCPEDRDKSSSETMVSTRLHDVAAQKSVITIPLW